MYPYYRYISSYADIFQSLKPKTPLEDHDLKLSSQYPEQQLKQLSQDRGLKQNSRESILWRKMPLEDQELKLI